MSVRCLPVLPPEEEPDRVALGQFEPGAPGHVRSDLLADRMRAGTRNDFSRSSTQTLPSGGSLRKRSTRTPRTPSATAAVRSCGSGGSDPSWTWTLATLPFGKKPATAAARDGP